MVNTDALKARMREKGVTQSVAAKQIQVSQPTLSLKLNNRRPFFLDEALALTRILEISMADFGHYFFAP